MKKIKFIILSVKKEILSILFIVFIIALVVFSKENLLASKNGLTLWINNVVPSLLPFFIATELLSYTKIVQLIGKLLKYIMKPVFNVPGIGSFALIMGIIAGYPAGAKIVANLKENGECSEIEAERLVAFTNNSGPLFILGTVGIGLYGNNAIGTLLLITHLLACLTVGIIFRFWKNTKDNKINCNKKRIMKKSINVTLSNLGDILVNSILSSVRTICVIGGFIMLASVLLSILEKCKIMAFFSNFLFLFLKIFNIANYDFSVGFVSGIVEVTNGIMKISQIPCKMISINIVLTSFLLGFGGLSVFMQVYGITSKAKISIKPYIIGKMLHGIIAAFYTCVAIYCFPIFNLNI